MREPLTHFMLAGAALFLIYSFFGPSEEIGEAQGSISVTAGKIESLSSAYARTYGRRPSGEMLRSLVEKFIREELAYREALEFGLDQGDPVIRQRLTTKYAFLFEDLDASPEEPTEQILREFLQQNRADFTVPARVSFRQIYIASESPGDAENRSTSILSALQQGVPPNQLGDATILPHRTQANTLESVSETFGDSFARNLATLSHGRWDGPVRSTFGFHIVIIDQRLVSMQPPLDDIRNAVRDAYLRQLRTEALDTHYRRLKDIYTIEIDWPESARLGIEDAS